MRRIVIVLIALTLALAAVPAPQSHAQSGALATVTTASFLNVRNAPALNAGIVAIIQRNYTYEVIARNADATWWLLNLRPTGLQGWASGRFLSVTNAHLVPVVTPPLPAPAGFATGTVNTGRLNVRAIPDPINGAILTTVSQQDVFRLLERTASSPVWYRIALADGSSGWVNGRYLTLANANLVPVTPGVVLPLPTPVTSASGTVTAFFLNVRTEPNPFNSFNIITQVARNQTLPVIGRNSAGTWWQVVLPNGVIGWVSGRYLSVTNAQVVPVTLN